MMTIYSYIHSNFAPSWLSFVQPPIKALVNMIYIFKYHQSQKPKQLAKVFSIHYRYHQSQETKAKEAIKVFTY